MANKKDVKQMMELVQLLENRYGSLSKVSEDDAQLNELRSLVKVRELE